MAGTMSGAADPREYRLAAGASPKRSTPLPVMPIVGFLVLWLGGSGLVVGALLHPMLPGGWVTTGAIAALVAVPVRVMLRGIGGAAYPSARTRLLVVRPFWYAMLFLPVLAVAGLAGAIVGIPFDASGIVGRWALGGVGALLVAGSLVGFVGARRLVTRHLEIRLPNLPEAFDGLRIVQLSDLHVGPHTSSRYLARVVDAVRNARPDLVAITGDQVDDYGRDVTHFAAAFGDVSAPLGVFSVAGNHDVYAGWEVVRRGMAEMGITVLVNDAVGLDRDGRRLWIAGTGDPAGQYWPGGGGGTAAPDIERTLRHIPAGEPVVALAHNPVLWPELARRGVALTLSGHTHYGQLALPRWGWSVASPFVDLAMGAHRRGGSILYISPGTNYWGIPFRIGAPPEVTVVTLRRSENGEPMIASGSRG